MGVSLFVSACLPLHLSSSFRRSLPPSPPLSLSLPLSFFLSMGMGMGMGLGVGMGMGVGVEGNRKDLHAHQKGI